MEVTVWECEDCGRREFVRRHVCTACGGRRLARGGVPGKGTVYASTLIRVAPGPFAEQTPYWIVLADLDGVRVAGRLSPSSPAPSVGSTVEVRRTGDYLELEVAG
jgi:uncharacterized protein